MHIRDSEWQAFYESGINSREILSHVAGCDYCANRMAELIPSAKVVEPMPYLDDMILREVARYSAQKQLASRFEFMFYCIRVGVAMCFALFILFTSDFTKVAEQQASDIRIEAEYNQSDKKDGSISQAIRKTTGGISDVLNSFYFDISSLKFNFGREDNNYEKAEK